MRESAVRGENPEGRDLEKGHPESIAVVSMSSAVREDLQEEGDNLRNGKPVGTDEMADG